MHRSPKIHQIQAKNNQCEIEFSLNYFTLINTTLVTMTNHMSNVLLEKNPPDILIDISRNCAGIFEFYKAQEIIEIGEKAIINAMSEIEAKILF